MPVDLIVPQSTLELGVVAQDAIHDTQIGVIHLRRGDDVEVAADDLILEGALGLEEVVEVGGILNAFAPLGLLEGTYILLLLALDIQLTAPEELDLALQRHLAEGGERLCLRGVVDELHLRPAREDRHEELQRELRILIQRVDQVGRRALLDKAIGSYGFVKVLVPLDEILIRIDEGSDREARAIRRTELVLDEWHDLALRQEAEAGVLLLRLLTGVEKRIASLMLVANDIIET